MNNTSLEFFKSLIERDTKVMEMLLKDNTAPSGPTSSSTTMIGGKPYSNIKFVNDVLTVVLNDGNIISKHPATADDFQRARNAKNEVELFAICMVKEVYDDKRSKEKEIEKIKALAEGAKKLAAYPDYFDVRDGSVYVKDISRSLPPLLVEEFLLVISKHNPLVALDHDDNFTALYNFWMWCCLNPRAEVADKLFNFLKKNSFKITKQGFFTALRNVVTVHGGTEFVQFVSESYNKVKAVWKKSPDNYGVFLQEGQYKLVHHDEYFKNETHTTTTCPDCLGEGGWDADDEDREFYDFDDDRWIECERCDGTGEVDEYEHTESWLAEHGERIGNLTELYLDLPNRAENRFTDAHTGTFDIRVGQVVHMDPDKCRWNTDDCGAEGLHFTSDEIHYVGCGDQSVLVLINPMKVVGIGESKGRCWEYLPIMTVPRDEATTLLHDLDFDTLELDEAFTINEMKGLQDKVVEGFTAEAKKYSVNFPTISMEEVSNIVDNLNRMQHIISKRVNSI
jgi:hypothetical protein